MCSKDHFINFLPRIAEFNFHLWVKSKNKNKKFLTTNKIFENKRKFSLTIASFKKTNDV